MCNDERIPEMTGLHADHAKIIADFYGDQQQVRQIVQDLHRALTRDLYPHLPVLPGLAAMIESLQRQDFGVLEDFQLVRMPLSIVGADLVRYRTPVVSWLHESVLSFRMSDLAVDALRQALKPHGLCVLFLCSCGVVVGRCDHVLRFYKSAVHREMDQLRSAIDADGHPVREVAYLTDIPVSTMDLSANGAEARMLQRIEDLTRFATLAGAREQRWVPGALKKFIARADSRTTQAA